MEIAVDYYKHMPEEIKENNENPVKVAGAQATIRTRDLPQVQFTCLIYLKKKQDLILTQN